MNQFSNVDFSFRRGSRSGIDHAPIKNGSFNIAVDTEEMVVDIDDTRVDISSVVYKEDEAAIRAITNPGNKLYIAEDTEKAMVYINNEWTYVSGGTVATHDADGLMSKEDKTKIDTMTSGAEPNQNAFSVVNVNGTNIAADSKSDTVTVTIGTGLNVTANPFSDSISISSKIWTGTKEEYEMIHDIDPETIYFID